MRIFNTMSRSKEEFVPVDENEVKIYACGPTVYNYIHIGNARPLCVFDVLRRYLEYRGYNVKFVQNFQWCFFISIKNCLSNIYIFVHSGFLCLQLHSPKRHCIFQLLCVNQYLIYERQSKLYIFFYSLPLEA